MTISIEKLKTITKIISHASCADGMAAANFCKRNGGAGHARAAGFTTPVDLAWDPNPYKAVREAVEAWEARAR